MSATIRSRSVNIHIQYITSINLRLAAGLGCTGQDTFALQESDPVHASMVRLFASFVKTVKICEKSSPTLQPRHWTSSEEGNFCVTSFQGTDMSHLRAWHCYVRHMAACLPWHLVARKGYSVRCKIIKSFIEKKHPGDSYSLGTPVYYFNKQASSDLSASLRYQQCMMPTASVRRIPYSVCYDSD